MTLYEILTDEITGVGIPCVYSHYTDDGHAPVSPPYLSYIGEGQNDFPADNTYYFRRNNYQIEYYFTKKDENMENRIENVLLDNGFPYSKSDDVFIQSEGVFVIYYHI